MSFCFSVRKRNVLVFQSSAKVDNTPNLPRMRSKVNVQLSDKTKLSNKTIVTITVVNP